MGERCMRPVHAGGGRGAGGGQSAVADAWGHGCGGALSRGRCSPSPVGSVQGKGRSTRLT
ncbi:hypothetical protein E2562_001739 [Oryza meyeriana var. granulata]|uniref:Uncharacterized protein n=1 Tax=Oryza meyeriana var. granulata TaxID=110450 RepID=A0A6G1CC67_9ORYZ|nr:hypothetical protein E2562_001739 [Oryza meyeriana var. granulata]